MNWSLAVLSPLSESVTPPPLSTIRVLSPTDRLNPLWKLWDELQQLQQTAAAPGYI